jgi:hypothetical protein
MPIDEFDHKLPEGYTAEDFGQSDSKAKAHLVSEYPSPLYVGRVNAYIVFVPGFTDVVEYIWTITNSKDEDVTLTTQHGRLRWKPVEPGMYTIEVEVKNSSVSEKLSLQQEVKSLPDEIERLKELLKKSEKTKEPPPDKIVPVGNMEVGTRVICELLPYASDAAAQTGGAISTRLLCTITYTSMLVRGNRTSAECLYPSDFKKAEVLNELPSKNISDYTFAIKPSGVCRMKPIVVALHEYPNEIKIPNGKPPVKADLLKKQYKELVKDKEIRCKIYNILRFPKTSLRIAAKFLEAQQNLWKAAVEKKEWEGNFDLQDPKGMGIQSLATIFGNDGFLFAKPVKGSKKLRINKFGQATTANYKLPLLTFRVEPDNKTNAFIVQWQKDRDDEQRALWARKTFFFGMIHYVYHAHKINEGKEKPDELQDVLQWIIDNIESFEHEKFPYIRPYDGRIVFINKELKGPLKNALEDAKDALCDGFEIVYGFCPRRIRKEGPLSNHATGHAIDFDPPSNPYWFEAEIKGINYLLNKEVWMKGKQSTYSEMAQINAEFMDEKHDVVFNAPVTECNDLTITISSLVKARKAGGLLTIPKKFVLAMIKYGFGWGGHYRTKRDMMHFEYPPVQGGEPPPGEERLP